MKWMNYFMAGFFITFSFFKFLDLRAFADSYSMYDLLAKRVRTYGFVYPFIELAMGIAYLTHFAPNSTYIATIVVMGAKCVRYAINMNQHIPIAELQRFLDQDSKYSGRYSIS